MAKKQDDILIFIDKKNKNIFISIDYYLSMNDTFLVKKNSIVCSNCDPEDYNVDYDNDFPDEIILGPSTEHVFIDTYEEILKESKKTSMRSIFSML